MLLYCQTKSGSENVELTWLMRLRIAAAMAIGVILIGILAWPLAAPDDPLGPVRAGNLSPAGTITLALLALAANFIAYFICWPYGREIGVLATPTGLAVWATRSGSMAQLMQQNPVFSHRQAIFATLSWEPIFWLAIVATGFAGVILGQKLLPTQNLSESVRERKSNPSNYLNLLIGLAGSGLIALFCITMLAQDVGMADNTVGMVLGQPARGQIIFAVLVSLGIAAFVVKRYLNVSYIWPIIAGCLITPFAISIYARATDLQHLAQRWPPVFFSNAAISILPVQMVAFGALGSIAGYWLAVRYNYRREHKTE